MPSPDIDSQSSQYSSNETLTEHVSSSNENDTSSNEGDRNNNSNGRPTRKVSTEHTEYVVKERITRKDPPKPAYNPMQFVQIKPCNLYQSAQEQLKKVEQIKKVKEVTKEDAEDWQSNLDNWKSSRRKRVEHIIDRVVEVKKFEEEEHERNRRKSKTFSEIIEERGSRRKLSALALYPDDDSNDLSDLGLGSGNENRDKNMENSDSSDADNKPNYKQDKNDDVYNNNNNNANNIYSNKLNEDNNRRQQQDNKPSNGLHSTALIRDVIHKKNHPPIEDKPAKLSSTMTADFSQKSNIQISTAVRTSTKTTSISTYEDSNYTYDSAIEDYKSRVSKAVNNNRVFYENESRDRESTIAKLDLPKVDISKRRELFEKEGSPTNDSNSANKSPLVEIVSIKDRISSLQNNLQASNAANVKKIDVDTTTKLKDRLSSLHSSISMEEFKKPIDPENFISRKEFENRQHLMEKPAGLAINEDNESLDTDREDSGIHTTDVSCSVSQSDEQQEPQIEEAENNVIKQQQHQPQQEVELKPTQEEEEIEEAQENENIDDESVSDQEDDDEPLSPQSVLEGKLILNISGDRSNITEQVEVIEEALDMAFQAIDEELNTDNCIFGPEPIYENVEEAKIEDTQNVLEPVIEEITVPVEKEPYYQVPQMQQDEPYYQVPKKQRPIPLYENVDLISTTIDNNPVMNPPLTADSTDSDYGVDDGNEIVFPIEQSKYLMMEPPKEKPPPPPDDEPLSIVQTTSSNDVQIVDQNFKRINSTKRIKKEIRNKRSSFLGIEGQDFDDFSLELSVAPPPDMAALLQEEKRLEKQLYQKVGLYENSDNGESRDSGLSDNHSRQSSVPSSSSSEEQNGIFGGQCQDGILFSERSGGGITSYTVNQTDDDDDSKIKSLENQIREQEEVLRVERELLQLEKEELKRQRENLIMRKNFARRELDEGVKMLMSNSSNGSTNNTMATSNRLSLQDLNVNVPVVNGTPHMNNNNFNNFYENLPNSYTNLCQQQQSQAPYDYRKSMPNLQNIQEYPSNYYHPQQQQPPQPVQQQQILQQSQQQFINPYNSATQSSSPIQAQPPIPKSYQHTHQNHYNNMSRHSLLTISAVPKPKFTNDWVHYRKSEPVKQSLNSHWLIQEAEQRRIEQMNNVRTKNLNNSNGNCMRNGNKKPLPDSIIQTLTQRVQSMGYNDKKRLPIDSRSSSMDPLVMHPKTPSAVTLNSNNLVHNPLTSPFNQSAPQIETSPPPPPPHITHHQQQDKLLSVSSKKKCSYCSKELKMGAAMIIENLGLFYHIDCFRCSVCHINISDGSDVNGTDVRVRNNKLHCHNCFSNDDGIKFSCV